MKVLNIIYLVAQCLAVALFVGSVQFKKKKNILLSQIGASMFYAIAYFMNGFFFGNTASYSGMYTEFLEESKNFTFWCFERKNKKIPFFALVLFVGLLLLFAVISYIGVKDLPILMRLAALLPYVVNIIYFVSSYFKNPKYIRLSVFLCGFIWLMYNISTGSYIICLGNAFEIISGGISLLRFKNEGNKKKRNNTKKVKVH